mgnify:CR=1 FL=1
MVEKTQMQNVDVKDAWEGFRGKEWKEEIDIREFIQDNFDDVDFKLTAKGLFTPISFYTSALYLQIEKLKKDYDLSQVLTSKGGLSGISKRGFTKKDFILCQLEANSFPLIEWTVQRFFNYFPLFIKN